MITALAGRLAAAASLVLLLVPSPARAADPPGVLWETTSQMAMAGMPMQMPAQTQKVCSAKTWTKPPPGGDKSCVSSDYKMVGNKATWKIQCSGQNVDAGHGRADPRRRGFLQGRDPSHVPGSASENGHAPSGFNRDASGRSGSSPEANVCLQLSE